MDREAYLAQFKTDTQTILGGRVLPPRQKEKINYVIPPRDMRFKFACPGEMQNLIDLYYERCATTERPPTMAGLALALGFTSKGRLLKYGQDHEEYLPYIETAQTRMEEFKNEKLLEGGSTFSAYALDLKNQHGWADKVEQTQQVRSDTLAELVQALQGRVLRPVIDYDYAEDAEYEDLI
jgi:hypothetical protein